MQMLAASPAQRDDGTTEKTFDTNSRLWNEAKTRSRRTVEGESRRGCARAWWAFGFRVEPRFPEDSQLNPNDASLPRFTRPRVHADVLTRVHPHQKPFTKTAVPRRDPMPVESSLGVRGHGWVPILTWSTCAMTDMLRMLCFLSI